MLFFYRAKSYELFTHSRIHAFTLILILFLSPSFVNSQSKDEINSQSQGEPIGQSYIQCGTPDSPDDVFESRPWYGNNAILPSYTQRAEEFMISHLSDSLTAVTRDDFDECFLDVEAAIVIPIQLWVYLKEVNPRIPSQIRLKRVIERLNNHFLGSGMNVRFNLLCPQFIFNDEALVLDNFSDDFPFGEDNFNDFAINIHIIEEIGDAGGVYKRDEDFIIVRDDVFSSFRSNSTTLTHEIGHYFQLDHTHQSFNKGKCRQEAVDRNRNYGAGCIFKYGKICEKSGDGFCDTPAEFKLDSEGVFDGINCQYIGNEKDNWGDSYLSNDGKNFMSYASRRCRNSFTPQQIGAMWHNILEERDWMLWLDMYQLDPDKYEPDDSDEVGVPSLITIGEKQCHSFHHGDCQDEVDWLVIDNSNGFLGSLVIELDQITETGVFDYEYPVEEIIIWDTDETGMKTSIKSVSQTQIGTKDVYEIACEENMNDILIQVIRKENIEVGLYSISLELESPYEGLPEIVADDQICIGNTLTIDNLPEGASVSWGASDELSLSSNNGISTSIVNAIDPLPSSQGYFVFANISIDGCILQIRHTFDEVATNNFPPFLNITMEVQGAECEPVFTFSVPPIVDATHYEWSCSSGNINFDGCYDNNSFETWGSAALAEGEQINISVSLEISNDCGSNIQTSRTFIYTASDNCDMRSPDLKVDITPNPISFGQEMSIIITDESEIPSMDYNVIISSLYSEIEYNINVDQLENQLNINSLSTGVYYLHIISGEKTASKMFVIQN